MGTKPKDAKQANCPDGGKRKGTSCCKASMWLVERVAPSNCSNDSTFMIDPRLIVPLLTWKLKASAAVRDCLLSATWSACGKESSINGWTKIETHTGIIKQRHEKHWKPRFPKRKIETCFGQFSRFLETMIFFLEVLIWYFQCFLIKRHKNKITVITQAWQIKGKYHMVPTRSRGRLTKKCITPEYKALTLTLPNKLLATLLIMWTAWCFIETCGQRFMKSTGQLANQVVPNPRTYSFSRSFRHQAARSTATPRILMES